MQKLIAIFFLIIFLSILHTPYFILPASAQSLKVAEDERLEVIVNRIIDQKEIDLISKKQLVQEVEVKVLKGQRKDEVIKFTHGSAPLLNNPILNKGDQIIITKTIDLEGKPVYLMTDYLRKDALIFLFIIFMALVLLIGRLRGLASILGMGISFLVIFYFLLPKISQGSNPILISIISALVIIPVTFYLSHGINRKTSSAVLGTIISLLVTGVLASYFISLTRLTGFASEEAGFLQLLKQGSINIQSLVLAGVIIGLLGILDDITVSQAAIVSGLKKASPKISFAELYLRAMDIGRDHIASLVNTLILVYTGAALPLLLLFIDNPKPISEVMNYEIIAEEIVRTLLASIGLILAVPITTLIASIWLTENDKKVKI